jgi:hypothetical protein
MAIIRFQKDLKDIEQYKTKGYTIANLDLFYERLRGIERIKQENTFYPRYSTVKRLHDIETQLPSRGAADE